VLSRILEEKKSSGLRVIGAAFTEEAAETLPRFLERAKPGYVCGVMERGAALALLKKPAGERLIPGVALLDRSGKLVEFHDTASEFFRSQEAEEANLRGLAERGLK
jgi:hypothetical protein